VNALNQEYENAVRVKFPTMTRYDELAKMLTEQKVPLKEPPKSFSGYDAYARLLGEAEARATQHRMDYSDLKRKIKSPFEDLMKDFGRTTQTSDLLIRKVPGQRPVAAGNYMLTPKYLKKRGGSITRNSRKGVNRRDAASLWSEENENV
jgi:hypothetical protein